MQMKRYSMEMNHYVLRVFSLTLNFFEKAFPSVLNHVPCHQSFAFANR